MGGSRLKSLFSHKRRLIGTASAVVLAVAFCWDIGSHRHDACVL